MSDIFLSYSREDQATARRFADGLERAGFSVWWDQTLRSGEAYDEVTERSLQDAKAVVVLWSKKSVASRWVRAEATQADRSKTLMPVMIEACTRPIIFELTHTADLSHWTGNAADPAWRTYVADVRRFVDRGQVTPSVSASIGGPRHQRRSSTTLVAGLCVGVVLAAGVLWMLLHHNAQPPVATQAAPVTNPSAPAVSTAKPRIAVLPFENLSRDPDNAFFADGLHEEVLTALANSAPGLEVISRTTMDTFKGKPTTVQTIAKELGCAYVLEGSVRRDGNTVRLTVQLIDARNDTHVWAENYDRKLVNAMSLQSEVAAAVASQLSLKVAGAAAAQSPVTTDPLAYDFFLKARAAEDMPGEASSRDAAHLLDQAIEQDASFARAYVERIGLRVNLFLGNIDSTEANLARIHQDLAKAKELAPHEPAVIAADAFVAFAEMNYDGALTLFDAATRAGLADPRLLDWKAKLLFAMGRYRDAATLSRQLVELDPRNAVAQYRFWEMLMQLHEGREALRVTELGLVKEPQSPTWSTLRPSTLMAAGGNLDPLRVYFAPGLASALRDPASMRPMVGPNVFVLTLQHRYSEALRLLDSVSGETWNAGDLDWPNTRVGPSPIAAERGWLDLLLGDAEAARKDGQRIQSFLASHPETRWNKGYRTLLRAKAQLLMGDKVAAIKTANEAVAIARATPDVSDQANAQVYATRITAWAGATEDAAKQLEGLSTSIPGVWPGLIVLDPIWTVPLAKNERYMKLRERLIEQMKATKLD